MVVANPSFCLFQAQPNTILAEVMSKLLYIAFPDQALEEVDHHFTEISGIPVVDDDYRCIGVLSKKDRLKASDVSASTLLRQSGKFSLYVVTGEITSAMTDFSQAVGFFTWDSLFMFFGVLALLYMGWLCFDFGGNS